MKVVFNPESESLVLKNSLSGTRLDALSDVDTSTSTANGSVLVYDNSTDNYVQRDSLDGTITNLRIDRSQDVDTPTALANGELSYSFSSNKLYIGQTESSNSVVSVEYIGGKLVVDKVANLESAVAQIPSFSSSAVVNNSVLIGISNEVQYITGTTGKVLQISANGAPIFDNLDGGTF